MIDDSGTAEAATERQRVATARAITRRPRRTIGRLCYQFYLRDVHIELMREARLILGVNTQSELGDQNPKLRQRALLMEDKRPQRTTYEDAKEFAKYMCHEPKGADG